MVHSEVALLSAHIGSIHPVGTIAVDVSLTNCVAVCSLDSLGNSDSLRVHDSLSNLVSLLGHDSISNLVSIFHDVSLFGTVTIAGCGSLS